MCVCVCIDIYYAIQIWEEKKVLKWLKYISVRQRPFQHMYCGMMMIYIQKWIKQIFHINNDELY